MRTSLRPLPHDLAVVAGLETLGKPVGFAAAPDGAFELVRTRKGPDYLVLYPIGGGSRSGTFDDPHADGELVYQVTVVGRAPGGVRFLVGLLEGVFAGLDVTGRRISLVVPEDLGGVRFERDVDPPVFYATPTFRIFTTPST